MRHNAYDLVRELINEELPFRLVVWNNNNWNMDLPDSIMADYPTQLIMDMNAMALEHCYVDDNGEIILTMMFGDVDEPYSKVLSYDEVIAVIDIDTLQPYVINPFKADDTEDVQAETSTIRLTREGLIRQLTEVDGLQKKDAIRSIDAILKHNPQYAHLLS